MILKSLSLKNYRCFPALEPPVEFHPQMTVIAAVNGRGKSSILDAITVALSPYTGVFENGDAKNFKKSDATLSRVEIAPILALSLARSLVTTEAQFPVSVQAIFDITEYFEGEDNISARRSLDSPGGKTKSAGAARLKEFGEILSKDLSDKGEAHLLRLPIISYYGTGRLHAQKRLMQKEKDAEVFNPNSRTMGYLNCLSAESTYKHFAEWMETTTLAQLQEGLPDYLQGMPGVYQAMLDGVSAAVQCLLDGQEWSDLRYTVKERELTVVVDGNGRLPLSYLSDGLRSIIAMVGDIAYRCTALNPQFQGRAPLETPGIVLIDEIEMHLHPSWQQKVLQQLAAAFPKIQFICTTHSPQVLSAVHPESIRTIHEDGRITSPNHKTYGAESKRVLEEVMGVPSRPPVFRDELREFIRITEKGDWSSARYLELRGLLLENLGPSDPAMIDAEVRRNFQQLEEEE